MDSAQFAQLHRVDPRTVQRWLQAGEIPGATKLPDGRWQIPADAMRIKPLPGTDVAMTPTRRDSVGAVADTTTRRDDVADTLAGTLAKLPALLTVKQAARLLGIPQTQVVRNAGALEAVPWGYDTALMIPQRVVRRIAGLSQ